MLDVIGRILAFIKEKGFQRKDIDSIGFPDVSDEEALSPIEEVEGRYGICGFVDDTREEGLGLPASKKYYNRKEPDLDRELKRLRKKLRRWGIPET